MLSQTKKKPALGLNSISSNCLRASSTGLTAEFLLSITVYPKPRKKATGNQERAVDLVSIYITKINVKNRNQSDPPAISNSVDSSQWGSVPVFNKNIPQSSEKNNKKFSVRDKAYLEAVNNNGNIIPLSERFKDDNEDIRYKARIKKTEQTTTSPLSRRPASNEQGSLNSAHIMMPSAAAADIFGIKNI